MKYIVMVLVVMASCSSISQNSRDIIRIEFTSITRGYHESIIMTRDSMLVTKSQTGEAKKMDNMRKLKKNEWADLLKTLQKVSLAEIPALESPSMKRAYDGARHSTISITTKTRQVYSHSFDNEDPHEKLIALMMALK